MKEMDGVKVSKKITVILATNDPKELDPKILSRMDEREEVALPDAKGLFSIIQIHLKQMEKKFNIEVQKDKLNLDEISVKAYELKLSGRDVRDILGILNRKRGQLQLNKIMDAIKNGRIPTVEGLDETDIVKNVVSRIKQRNVEGIEDLVLPPIANDELMESFIRGKTAIEDKKRKMGFV